MTYEIYRYIFIGGAVMAGIMFAVSVLVYIGKQKKKGNKCIGCPHGGNCSGSCGSQDK